jgi:arylsulfatase A-like enzyme
MKMRVFFGYKSLTWLLSVFVTVISCKRSVVGVAETQRPNFILVMADDLGWGDVGFNGNSTVRTPHLDALASDGLIFDRFYAAAPVCSPTRASVMTGRNPFRMNIHTANSGHLKTEEITLAELLQELGYATGMFGKWHLGTLTTKIEDANRGRPGNTKDYAPPDQHGFDTYFVTESKVPTYDPALKPQRFNTELGESLRYGWAAVSKDAEVESYGTAYWSGPEERVPASLLMGDDTQVIMDRAIKFIQQCVEDERAFLSVIWLHTPHLPVVASETYMDLYRDLSHEEQLYYGTITAMDDQIGILVDRLNELDVLDNTVIWFASDNGPELRTPGNSGGFRGKKRDLYEGGLRVPAFIYAPGFMPGDERTSLPAFTSDYLPTILGQLDQFPPDDRPLDGLDIVPKLKAGMNKRGSGFGFLAPNRKSWVNDQFKLISNAKNAKFELYDLINDPYEKYDLIDSLPGVAERMEIALNDWIRSCTESALGKDY